MPRSKPEKKAERERQVCFQLPESELKILEAVCKEEARTKTDILREFIRGLKRKRKTDDNH